MGFYLVTLGLCIAWCNDLRELVKSKLVGPWQATVLVCATQAIEPVYCMSVYVLPCAWPHTTWAAAPIRAVSAGVHFLCAQLCVCSADVHGVSSVVGIVVKCENICVCRPGK
jgi:hypothetical protein